MANSGRSTTRSRPVKGWTPERAREMGLRAWEKYRSTGVWPLNRWTSAQAREMGKKGGVMGDHPNKLANLRKGPAAAVAARVEYMRLKREREASSSVNKS